MMTLLSPHWLLLLVPVVLLWWWFRPSAWCLRGLRACLYVLIVLAMCEPRLVLPHRSGTVVVVVDRSASMPGDAAARQLEMVKLLHASMSPDDRLAVVSFGERVAMEQNPSVDVLTQFAQAVGGDASDLSGAMRRSLAMIPDDGAGRLIVLSDGMYTGQDPRVEAARAAARGVPIDFRELSRPVTRDLAVTQIDAPSSVQPGESFMITGWVHTTLPQTVAYELIRGEVVVAAGTRALPVGLSRLTFRDRALSSRSMDYHLRLSSAQGNDDDPIPENNVGRFMVGVQGDKPLLLVTDSPGRGLANLLATSGLDVQAVTPEQLTGTLTELSDYAGVLIENVSASDLPSSTLDQLASLVESAGLGLVMTGGQRSFGPGGYYQSAIDPILPVSMELRQEHRKLSLAIVIALDRSGSMAMPVPDGRTKMDLANLGSAQVLDLLGPMDELGVIAVDSAPHTIVELGSVRDKTALKRKILSIDSMGGGIYVYEALSASAGMLANAVPSTRHIILFADAQDSVEPGAYKALLEKAGKANMTVSVIGLGSDKDVHAPLLQDIARRGGGRAFFTQDPKKLPQLFAQDTFVVARSSFIDERTPVRNTGALAAMTGRSFTGPLDVGGYNLNYLKPDAQLAMVTDDEYRAPLVASWQAGLGRVAVYTGEADGKFTGPIADWAQLGDLLASLTRWVAARDRQLPDTMLARQRLDNGVLLVELMVDPESTEGHLLGEPTVNVLLGQPGTAPREVTLPMHYTAPDTLAAQIPLTTGTEVAVATLDLGSAGMATLPPARLLYSPEYLPRSQDGLDVLRALADLTEGIARTEMASVWDDLVPIDRFRSIAHWLWLAAVVVLLLEVLERRTSWISQFALMFAARRLATARRSQQGERGTATDVQTEADALALQATGGQAKRLRGLRRKTAQAPSGPTPANASPPQPSPVHSSSATPAAADEAASEPGASAGDLFTAMDQAKRSADRRTGH